MSRLSDVANGAIRKLLGYRNETPSAASTNLAINAASAATFKTLTALQFTNDGIWKYKAALSAQSIVPTHNWQGSAVSVGYVQPISKTVYYTVGLNAAGTVAVVQGSYSGQQLSSDPTVGVGQAVMGATWVGDGSVPDVPDGYTPIGIIKVTTNGSTTFTPGTTALDAAGVTVTYTDVQVMPSTAP